MAPSLTSYSSLIAHLLNFAMISHRWVSVKRIALGFIHFPLRFIESEDLESDMSKVRTYQLSARTNISNSKCVLKQDIIVVVSARCNPTSIDTLQKSNRLFP
jgi:hypothetical protein